MSGFEANSDSAYWENGKDNGSYYIITGVYGGYFGIMENETETTIMSVWVYGRLTSRLQEGGPQGVCWSDWLIWNVLETEALSGTYRLGFFLPFFWWSLRTGHEGIVDC